MMFLNSCSNTVKHESDYSLITKYLSFIQDGVSTRKDIVARLGNPSAFYYQDRCFIYWIHIDKEGLVEVTSADVNILNLNKSRKPIDYYKNSTGYYNLILIFNEMHILDKHNLIRIH